MQLADLLIDAGLVAGGAAAGTPARHFITGVVSERFGETFPWGTLVVNVTGCVLIGVLAAVARRHGLTLDSAAWLLLVTGFLGSYTTVSSFALQTHALARGGERKAAGAYVGLSLILCLAATAIAFLLASHAMAGAGR